jgi:hypothetical protein
MKMSGTQRIRSHRFDLSFALGAHYAAFPLECQSRLSLAASASFSVATHAQSNQIVHHVAAELTPGLMNLQTFHGTTHLTPPTISF